MKANKLTLKDQFLNLSQAKELKELGIDFEATLKFSSLLKEGDKESL